MKYLSFVDVSIVLLYFVILISIGMYLKKRASKNISSYFLGGRELPWWLLGVSGMAAWVDMTGTMIITSFLFMLGPRGLFIEFRGGAGLALIFLMLWLGKWHRRSGCVTAAEWMNFRFGTGPSGNFARLMAVVSMLVFSVGILSMLFFGAGLFLSMFLPFQPWVCALALLLITMTYALSAGFYGVVIADFFQMGIFIFAAVYVFIVAFLKVRGHGDFETLVTQVTNNSQWMSAVPSLYTEMPKGYEEYSGLMLITVFYTIKTFIHGFGMGAEPRYFGARNDKECGLISFLAGNLMSVRWVLMIGFVVLGVFLINDVFSNQAALSDAAALIKSNVGQVQQSRWAELISDIMNKPENYSKELIAGLNDTLGSNWSKKLSLLSFEGTVETERIVPAVLLFSIPSGIKGITLVALIAAAVSTINAFINMATGFFINDVYKNYIRPSASNKEIIYASYGFGIFLVAASFVMAYSTKSINDIWGWLMMGLAGGMCIPTVLRLYWWRFNGIGFAVGTIAGLLAAVLQRVFYQDMQEWNQLAVITTIGFIASVIATYLSAPTDRQVLEEFYIKTRPFGLWGPFKALFTIEQMKIIKREHFFDLVSLPFAFFWQVTILMVPMLLLIGAYKSMFWAIVIFVVSLVGLYFLWFKQLPRLGRIDDAQLDERLRNVSEVKTEGL